MSDCPLSLLLQAPVFRGAHPDDLRELAALSTPLSFRRGEALFHAGDEVRSLYLVVRGSVRVYRVGRGGTRELTLHVEGPRQLVAGVTAFQEQATPDALVSYPAHAEALQTPTELLSLPAQAVREAAYHTPALAQAVIAYFARRQAELMERMESLVFSELGERLAAYLLEHAAAPWPLPTNSELAALLGTVPELVSRKLGEFYRLGVIRLERRVVQVVDAPALAELAGQAAPRPRPVS